MMAAAGIGNTYEERKARQRAADAARKPKATPEDDRSAALRDMDHLRVLVRQMGVQRLVTLSGVSPTVIEDFLHGQSQPVATRGGLLDVLTRHSKPGFKWTGDLIASDPAVRPLVKLERGERLPAKEQPKRAPELVKGMLANAQPTIAERNRLRVMIETNAIDRPGHIGQKCVVERGFRELVLKCLDPAPQDAIPTTWERERTSFVIDWLTTGQGFLYADRYADGSRNHFLIRDRIGML